MAFASEVTSALIAASVLMFVWSDGDGAAFCHAVPEYTFSCPDVLKYKSPASSPVVGSLAAAPWY